MTEVNSRYGSALSINGIDDAIDRVVKETAAAYPKSAEDPFRHGYECCARTTLQALGLQGDALERTVASVCASVDAISMHIGAFVYTSTVAREEGAITEVQGDRVAVDWGSGVPEWFPLKAFGKSNPPYVDVSQKLSS